jgi:hypothetical protein
MDYSSLLRDDHAGRAHDRVAQSVALLNHLDDLARLGVFDGLRHQRLVDVRIECPRGLDLLETFALERTDQGVFRHPDSLEHLRIVVLLGCVQRALEIVEDGQELLDETFVRTSHDRGLIARDALAEVVEVGGDPLQLIQVLVALGLGLAELDL